MTCPVPPGYPVSGLPAIRYGGRSSRCGAFVFPPAMEPWSRRASPWTWTKQSNARATGSTNCSKDVCICVQATASSKPTRQKQRRRALRIETSANCRLTCSQRVPVGFVQIHPCIICTYSQKSTNSMY